MIVVEVDKCEVFRELVTRDAGLFVPDKMPELHVWFNTLRAEKGLP